jgi:hypothetical protein
LCSKKGKKVAFQKGISKPSWTLRGGSHSGGILFKSKEKHLKQGEKISNLENALQNSYLLPLTICKKNLEKIYNFFFAKTKHVVQAWSKMLNKKETIHAYLVSIYIG